MSAWLIYLWTRLDDVNTLLVIFIFASSIASIGFLLFGVAEVEDAAIKIGKKIGITAIITSILFAIIPTKKDAAIIYVAPKLANSEIVMKDCPELAKLGIEALKQQLLEFTKTKENKQ